MTQILLPLVRVTRYFDYEAYGQYLDDNGRFVETDHGIYELP